MSLAFSLSSAQNLKNIKSLKNWHMSKSYARPLLDHESIEGFIGNCLGIHKTFVAQGNSYSSSDIAKKIRDAESAVGQTKGDCTLDSRRNRVPEYREDQDRVELRERIVAELIQLDRLDNDDEIKLGYGGAKPKGEEPQSGSQAFIVIGLPASGKSTLVNSISDKLGAVILDSDFAKRKLPEFDGSSAGANLVHKESSNIVFGGAGDEPSLFGYCKTHKINIVVPTIGHDQTDLHTLRNSLIRAGYKVHLTATVLKRTTAAKRALGRFLLTGRYVPLGLIFDGYANDPIMTYYRERVEGVASRLGEWASFGAISTDSNPAVIVDCSSDDNPVTLLN